MVVSKYTRLELIPFLPTKEKHIVPVYKKQEEFLMISMDTGNLNFYEVDF